ncbi:MAG TPA: TetR/AcrR family transcriptional regulator [Thermodesulfobacteriota bacterium]|nr:TetR/AcrR family transcriptional regulator [Thermodesulfobacteriota bacterium]
MPKSTFQHLPDEKRERILRAATQLFAERGFNRTDMDEIAKRSEVAKGSLYNYFCSKDDLFVHVCRDAIARSRRATWGEVQGDWDIYQVVDHIFRRHVIFEFSYPEYHRLHLNFSSSRMERFADKLGLESEQHTSRRLKELLKKGIRQGIIRRDLDVAMTAFMINSLYILFMASLVSRYYQIRMKEYLDIEEDFTPETVEKYLERVLDFIRRHLAPLGKGTGKRIRR